MATTEKRQYNRYTGPINVSAISAEPDRKIGRKSNVDLTEYMDVLNKSRSQSDDKGNGQVFGMNVNADGVPTVKSRFRLAAAELGNDVGVSFEEVPAGHRNANPNWKLEPGFVRLLVQARPKRERPGNAPARAQGATKKAGARR